eukprot:365211-Chlamydomonas_euryale.AAC.3
MTHAHVHLGAKFFRKQPIFSGTCQPFRVAAIGRSDAAPTQRMRRDQVQVACTLAASPITHGLQTLNPPHCRVQLACNLASVRTETTNREFETV